MKGKKITSLLLIALFILSTLAIAIPSVSANPDLTVVLSSIPSTATHSAIEFATDGTTTPAWTTEGITGFSGEYCVGATPNPSTERLQVVVAYGEPLSTLIALTAVKGATTVLDIGVNVRYTASGLGTAPCLVLLLDTSGNGVVDSVVVGGFDVEEDGTLGEYEEWQTMYKYSNQPVWQIRDADDNGLLISGTYNGDYTGPAGTTSPTLLLDSTELGDPTVVYIGSCVVNNEGTSYFDDIIIGGVTHALEPSGNVEDTVTVSGTSTTPGGLIEVYWDSVKAWDGTAGLLESDYAVGYDYSIDITVPDGIVGDHYVIVKDVEAPATVLATLIVESEIVLDPATALAGDMIIVDGTGFAVEETIIINLDGGDPETTTPTLVETNALGWFSCTFDVPTGTVADVVVGATDLVNTATATLTIGATIDLDPTDGPSGTVVDITGIGFSTTPIAVEITIGGETAVEITPILTESDGTFSGQFIVPTLVVDEYVVSATDGSTSGTSDFEVTGITSITLTPGSGVPDSEITIEGFNFTSIPGEEVTITFGGLEQDGTFVTDSDGSFEGTIIVPSLVADTYTISALDVNDLYAEVIDFRVVFTTLAVSPSSGSTGTEVLVMGGGYTDTNDFNVTMDGVLMVDGTGTLTGEGSLPTTYVLVPTLPVGDYTITVMDDEGVTGTTSFEITETTEIILTPDGGPVEYSITLELNYFTKELGTDITVTMYNETAGERDYEYPLTPDIDFEVWTEVGTNATGGFEGTFLVPADLDIGDYIINATDANDLTVEASFTVVEVYMDIHTLSTEYDPGDTVSFYVNSTFAFILDIDIEDPTGYPFTTITCAIDPTVWVEIGDYYVVPYADASFVLPSDAATGSWNWTALEGTEELANGTFTVGEEPEEPEDEITDITLSVGWNLVSLPLIPDDSSIEVVLEGLVGVESVWSYDAATESWASYSPGAPSDLDEMVDGEGYWMSMTASAVLVIDGTEMPVDPFDPLPAYPVVEGWNLIGFKSTTPMTVDDYLAGVDYVRVYEFIDVYSVLSATDDMTPGRGYWMAASDPGTIYP